MKKKMVINIFIILIVILPIMFTIIRSKKNMKNFYVSNINSKVISYSDWQENSREYHLRNGLYIVLKISDTGKIKIGDSVSKGSNTYEYQIYRKNSVGKYEFFKTYSID